MRTSQTTFPTWKVTTSRKGTSISTCVFLCAFLYQNQHLGRRLSLSLKNSLNKERENQNPEAMQTLPRECLRSDCAQIGSYSDFYVPTSSHTHLHLPSATAPLCTNLCPSQCPQLKAWVLLKAVTLDKVLQNWHNSHYLRPGANFCIAASIVNICKQVLVSHACKTIQGVLFLKIQGLGRCW